MIGRVSFLFAFTSVPTDRTVAAPHSGGWSESFWVSSGPPNLDNPYYAGWAVRRARLLPQQCSIVGVRGEAFTIVGNKLLPGGTGGRKFLYPGNTYTTNIPQDALMLSGATGGNVNTTRFALRCIPDELVANGEYTGGPVFGPMIRDFSDWMIGPNVGFVGRKRSNPTARVMSVAGPTVTLSGPVGGVPDVDSLRFLRVYDVNGLPLKGPWLIHTIAGSVYTLTINPGQTVLRPSGLARIDEIAFFPFSTINVNRVVARKVGRPFEQYRGRRSTVRA